MRAKYFPARTPLTGIVKLEDGPGMFGGGLCKLSRDGAMKL
jgi:hypothetical protein